MSRSSMTVSAAFGMPEQAEARGEFAFVHHAVADQVGILGVMDDQRVEIAARRSARGA